VARKHGVAKSLLFRWRKEAGLAGKRRKAGVFIPVRLALASVATPAGPGIAQAHCDEGMIEIELSGGVKLRVSGSVKPEALRQVIAALRD
jgi:transposase